MGFYYQDQYLYCEALKIVTLLNGTRPTPFFLYSAAQIRQNFEAYQTALKGIAAQISYAVKANGNLAILKMLQKAGSWATLVSGNELKLALAAGFLPQQLIFNGNGKTLPELEFAIGQGVYVNIDSQFDLAHIAQTAQKLGKQARVLLRVNPNIDPAVHPYISTGLQNSKFGISPNQIQAIIDQLKKMPQLQCVGLHVHLGSTIQTTQIFTDAARILTGLFNQLHSQGLPVKFINLGGGLGINYRHDSQPYPTPDDLIAPLKKLLPPQATLIVEPGRSIVGDAGVLVCRVIGVKQNGNRRFIVTDGSMTELIRPSLYQAEHQIGFIGPIAGPKYPFDIVGPVCESADFLGKARQLPTPPEGAGLVVFDTGAYGFAMSSNYNARLRPAEYLVMGQQLTQIRKPETFADIVRAFYPETE